MLSSPYDVRSFVPEDRTSLEDLYRAIYGQAWRAKTNFGWTFDRPLAEAGAAVAVDSGVVVAAQPYCDLPLHTPSGIRRATLFLDVATHPDHQRRGLFRRVVDAARGAAFERGSSIIMTTPNRIASRGFQTMSGWVRLCSLDCLMLPLGSGDPVLGGGLLSLGARVSLGAAALLGKGFRTAGNSSPASLNNVEAPWLPGAEADQLWSCAAERAGILVVRDGAFLRWRFGSEYRLFLSRDDKTPTGYAAARVVTRAGLKVGMVLDCINVGDGTSAVRLLASMIGWLKDEGASVAMGYFLHRSVLWSQAREAGFFSLPRACAPRDYPVYVSVRPGEVHTPDLMNPSRWYMSLADSDLM